YLNLIEVLKDRKDQYKDDRDNRNFLIFQEIRNLKLKIEELEAEKGELFNRLTSISKGRVLNTEKEELLTETEKFTNEPPSSSQILFFSIPERDGTFKVSKGVKINDGSVLYRIEYEESNDFGKVYYIPGDFDRKAINN